MPESNPSTTRAPPPGCLTLQAWFLAAVNFVDLTSREPPPPPDYGATDSADYFPRQLEVNRRHRSVCPKIRRGLNRMLQFRKLWKEAKQLRMWARYGHPNAPWETVPFAATARFDLDRNRMLLGAQLEFYIDLTVEEVPETDFGTASCVSQAAPGASVSVPQAEPTLGSPPSFTAAESPPVRWQLHPAEKDYRADVVRMRQLRETRQAPSDWAAAKQFGGESKATIDRLVKKYRKWKAAGFPPFAD
jgi:hypothetical protein